MRVVNLLETGYLRLREALVKRITVIKFRIKHGNGTGTGYCVICVGADTVKLTNIFIRFVGSIEANI